MTEARCGATVVTIIITMWRDIGFNRQHWSAHSLLPQVLSAAQLQVNKKSIQINVANLNAVLNLFFPTSYLPTFQIFKVFRKKMEAQYTVYFEAKCLLKNIAFKQCAVVSTK